MATWCCTKRSSTELIYCRQIQACMVRVELNNDNWIHNLGPLNTPELLEEYILMYQALSSNSLTERVHNVIGWRWTTDGNYTVTSAYEIQFKGAVAYFPVNHPWKAMIEPKCRFFGWVALHDRIPTADNLATKNWPHQEEQCSLCICTSEDATHIAM